MLVAPVACITLYGIMYIQYIDYIQLFFLSGVIMCKRLKILFDDAQIYNTVNKSMKYMLSNPLLLIAFIIITATLILPIVFFTIFAVINVAIAFTGFIIIEGT